MLKKANNSYFLVCLLHGARKIIVVCTGIDFRLMYHIKINNKYYVCHDNKNSVKSRRRGFWNYLLDIIINFGLEDRLLIFRPDFYQILEDLDWLRNIGG